MAGVLKQYLLIFIAALALILQPTQAMAYSLLSCDDEGKPVEHSRLFYDDPDAPDDAPSFCSEVTPERIFSTIICSFVVILNDVLGKMYCGMQHTLQDYVAIIITIYIAVFGAQILMGTTQLTSKEMLIRLLKIGAVWVFVTNANWGVSLLFAFFIDFANQSIWWTLGAINDGTNFIAEDMGLPDTAAGISGVVPAYLYFDQIVYDVVSGPFLEANSKLIGLFAAVALAFPPVFMIAAYWLWTTFMILARTFIAFLIALSAIAFLIALSPIFFCFMLFQATFQFFETWLKYIISYSLQSLIVFAVIAMWVMAMLNFVAFFNQLSDTVFEFQKIKQLTGISKAVRAVGICPYIVYPGDTLLGPNVRCADPEFDPFNVKFTSDPSECDPSPAPCFALTEKALRDNERLITLSNIAPAQNTEEDGTSKNSACEGIDQTLPDAPQCSLNRFFYFMIYHLMTLIIIAYAFDALLKRAPYIAKELSGPQYVPILGQGFGGLGYHGIKGLSKMREDKDSNVQGVGTAVKDVLNSSRQMSQNPRSKAPGDATG